MTTAACSSSTADSFAPANCIVETVAVNGSPVRSPSQGAVIQFEPSGQLKITGRAGSQVTQTVHYHPDSSGYQATGFKGDFGYYDSYVNYDSALDDLLSGDVAVTRQGQELRMTVQRTNITCSVS